jgi:hypothetical protein
MIIILLLYNFNEDVMLLYLIHIFLFMIYHNLHIYYMNINVIIELFFHHFNNHQNT